MYKYNFVKVPVERGFWFCYFEQSWNVIWYEPDLEDDIMADWAGAEFCGPLPLPNKELKSRYTVKIK